MAYLTAKEKADIRNRALAGDFLARQYQEQEDTLDRLSKAIGNLQAGVTGPQGPTGPTGPQGPAGIVPSNITITGFQLTTAPVSGYVLTSDASGYGTWQAPSGGITGSGTSGKVTKFNGSSSVTDSIITELIGKIGVNTATPRTILEVSGGSGAPDGTEHTPLILRNTGWGAGTASQIHFDIGGGSNGSGYGASIAAVDYGSFDTRLEFRTINSAGHNNSILTSANTRMVIDTDGKVGINTLTPTTNLEVVGGIKSQTIQLTTGAVNGRVLTSDSSGNATWQTAASGVSGLTAGRIPYAATSTTLADDSWHQRYTGTAPGSSDTVYFNFLGDGARAPLAPNQESFTARYAVGTQIQSESSSPMLAMIKSGTGGGAYSDFPRFRMRSESGTFASPGVSPIGYTMGSIDFETRYTASATHTVVGGLIRGVTTDAQSASDRGLSLVMAATPANAGFGDYAIAATLPYTNIVASGRGVVLQAAASQNTAFYRRVPWFGATAGVSGGTADPGGGSFSIVKFASTGTAPPGAAIIYLGSTAFGNNGHLNNYTAAAQQMIAVVDGQALGTIQSMGWYHDHYNTCSGTASMTFRAVGNWTISTAIGSRIEFTTNPSGTWFTGGVTVVMTDAGGLDVGTNLISAGTAQFRVSGGGDITRIKDVTYSWPAVQGSVDTYLKNDGSGNLTWSTVAGGGITGTGTTGAITKWSTGGSAIGDSILTESASVISMAGDLIPSADNTRKVGTNAARFSEIHAVNVYTGDFHMHAPDGSAKWTFIEHPDHIEVLNELTGQRFQMVLKEI